MFFDFRTLLLTFSILGSPSLYAANVVHAVQDVWPPYVIDTSDYPGISVEIAQRAYASQGYLLELTIKPWARTMKEIQHGRDQIVIAAWHSADRDKVFRFSDTYLSTAIKLIGRHGEPFVFDGLSSLKGKKVGIIDQYAYDDQFMSSEEVKRVTANDLISNIRKVMVGRIDLLLEDERVARWTMVENDIAPAGFNYIQPPVSLSPLFIMVARDNPNAQRYLDAFNRGLQTIQKTGEYEAILHKYDAGRPKVNPPTP